MRTAGLENGVTSFTLSTHQANNEQYQRRADEAENFVNESQTTEATPPEDGRSDQEKLEHAVEQKRRQLTEQEQSNSSSISSPHLPSHHGDDIGEVDYSQPEATPPENERSDQEKLEHAVEQKRRQLTKQEQSGGNLDVRA